MNWYPEQLRAAALICETLNKLDNDLEELNVPGGTPFLQTGTIHLTDGDGSDLGRFVDEIGGAWSWVPPGEEALGEKTYTLKSELFG